MEFQHIVQAIDYAQKTGDIEPLEKYQSKRLKEAAEQIMQVMGQPLKGDDVYFMLAYAEALAEVTKASMEPHEQALVEAIRQNIHISIVKAAIPMPGAEGSDS